MSIVDHSLFDIKHENNGILFTADYIGVIYGNNPTVPVTEPRLKVCIQLRHHLVPDGQHPLLLPESLRGTRAYINQAVVEHPLSLFSGERAAATSAMEAMLLGTEITPLDLGGSADSYGRLLWRDSFASLNRVSVVDEEPLEGIAGAAARVSERITAIVEDVQSRRCVTEVDEIDVVLHIVKRTIVGAELYSSLDRVRSDPKVSLCALFETVTRGGGDEESNEVVCMICLEEAPSGTQISRLVCSHMFHENCILPWLTKSRTCPLCRSNLPKLCN